MKKIGKNLAFLIGILLLTASASAAPIYDIDESSLLTDGENYYLLYGSNLTLPLNISYETEEAGITWMMVHVNITQNGQQVTSGFTYDYTFSNQIKKPGLFGAVVGNEHIFEFSGDASGLGLNKTVPAALTINVTGITDTTTPYNVELEIYAGPGEDSALSLPDAVVTVPLPLKICSLYQGDTETNVYNTPQWNISTPLQVTTTLLGGTVCPAGEYTIPWDFYEIKRGNDNFSLVINETNTTSRSVLKQNNGIWNVAAASSVMGMTDTTLTLSIGDEDADADAYQILFTGHRLGDVISGGPAILDADINILDTSKVLEYYVSDPSKKTVISSNRLIYADVNDDGKINPSDATLVFWYHNKGVDSSETKAP